MNDGLKSISSEERLYLGCISNTTCIGTLLHVEVLKNVIPYGTCPTTEDMGC